MFKCLKLLNKFTNKKNIMRKIFSILLIIIGINTVVYSQITSFGGGITFATGAKYELEGLKYYNNTKALDLQINYCINKHSSIVNKLNLFYPKKETLAGDDEFSKTSLFILCTDYHYTPNPKNFLRLYYIGGPTFMLWKIKDQHYSSALNSDYNIDEYKFSAGIDLGIGINFDISNSYKLFIETKYIISKNNQLLFTSGVSYIL